LEICNLPSDFPVVSYAFNIYQQLKSDDDMKLKSINLCKSLSHGHFKTYRINKHLIDDLERVINIEENWFDKIVVITCFLRKIYVSFITIF